MALSRLFVLLLFVVYVSAHAWLSDPRPRGQFRPTPRRDDQEAEPVGFDTGRVGDVNDPNFVCRGDPEMSEAQYITLTAGQNFPFTVKVNAQHPGDCALYLTYDGDKPDNQKQWFKMWHLLDCATDGNRNYYFSTTIPDYLPTGSHVVLRFEWYSLQIMNAGSGLVEYYTQCVDGRMQGSAGGVLPLPQVRIPGHLPPLSSNPLNYRDPYNLLLLGHIAGPPIATRDGKPLETTTASTATTAASTAASTATIAAPTATTATSASPTTTSKSTSAPPTTTPGTTPEGNPCNAGSVRCTCTANGRCDTGLTCASNTCVDLADAIKGSAATLAALFMLSAGCIAVNLL
jgi:hypothetical protein